jgi:DNA-binding transcriptional ArsR family regulator
VQATPRREARVRAPAASDGCADAPVEGVCQTRYVDEVRVAAAEAALPSADVIERAADGFGALADPTRLRLLYALARTELCVCDLSRILGRSMGATSHQLQTLRRMGLVTYRMEGKLAYYRLTSDWVRALLDGARRRVEGEAAP